MFGFLEVIYCLKMGFRGRKDVGSGGDFVIRIFYIKNYEN